MKYTSATILILIFGFFLSLGQSCINSNASTQESKQTGGLYKCLPCGLDCDKKAYNKPGKCSECQMSLVEQSTITFKSIEPTAICDYIKMHPAAILLDVRTNAEFEGKANPDFGTLKNAVNIPVQELESKLSDISHLKNKEVLVFCSHSHRSPRASYLLTQNGFTNVTNMEGGMSVVKDTSCKK